MTYVGRFAPSPTGPLHAGSLLAAVGSWLDARSHRGQWHLRIDDLDRFRCRPEFESMQRATLDAFGLRPFAANDVPLPGHQSTRFAVYDAAIEALRRRVTVFACDCSRKDRRQEGDEGCLRDCRRRRCDPKESAWRADLSALPALRVEDRSLGGIHFDPSIHRDVIVRRRDGLPAYALAVVVDDTALGVTDVVRGGDLLAGTASQLGLHQALGLRPPRYLHLPVVVEADGRKLSKSEHAVSIDPEHAVLALRRTLARLRQPLPPEESRWETPQALLAWAGDHWSPEAFVGLGTVPAETDGR